MLESYNRCKIASQREQALMNEVLAIQIGNMVNAMFSKNVKVRSVKELLPDLFGKGNTAEHDWQNHMQKMREFTARHNQRRKGLNEWL